MTQVEQIKTEIKRRMEKHRSGHPLSAAYLLEDDEILEFINSLPEETNTEDERIRKALMQHIKDKVSVILGWRKEELLAWLEKQGELPHWKKSVLPNDAVTGFNSDYFSYNGYYINYKELFNKLPKDNFNFEKQGEQKTVSKTEPIVEGLTTEFQKQVSYLIASARDKEHEYTKGYIEWVAQSLLSYAKNEQNPINKVEPKPIWSEEDEKNLEKAIECSTNRDFVFQTVEEQLSFLDWLEFLKYRVQPQQKSSWSEEDEKTLSTVIKKGDLKPSEIQWLKSLKERYAWKPSDEQTNALYNVVSKNLMDACRTKDDVLLEQLLNDLMKLKGE